MSQPLDANQVEDLALVLRQALDRPKYAPPVRAEARGGAGWRRRNPGFRQGREGGLFIQAASQVIELPTHVLVG
jgi:hypothetical protein